MDAADRAPTALCVDDDEMHRDLVAAVFAKYLPHVAIAFAASGTEALAWVATPIDLLLVDGRLGDMHGADVVRHLRQAHPELRVLVVSGIDRDPAWPIDATIRSLRKPYAVRALADAVTALLDTSG